MENFITQFHDWNSGDVITEGRADGNITNIINGLSQGVKAIDIGKILIGTNEMIDANRNIAIGTATISTTIPFQVGKNDSGVSTEMGRYNRTSGSPTDNDTLYHSFFSENDNNEQVEFARDATKSLSVLDGFEKGQRIISTARSSDGTLQDQITIDEDGLNLLSGVLNVPDGIVGDPSLSFKDDPNTGLYSSATDGEMGFSSNGVNSLDLTSQGIEFRDSGTGVFTHRTGIISDDTAISFTPKQIRGYLLLFPLASAYADISGIITFRTQDDLFTKIVAQTSTIIEVTTGALTGTTGTDTKFTVSVHTDNKVYFENRFGSDVNIGFLLICDNA